MSTFEVFNDFFNNYPKIADGVKLDTSVGIPTNSWMQNAIMSNTPQGNRSFVAIPWSWTVDYTTGIYLLDCNFDALTKLHQGDIYQIQQSNRRIRVYDVNNTPYTLESVNDFGGLFESAVLKAYPIQGSIFANFDVTNTDMMIDFTIYTITNVSTINNVTTVDVSYVSTSEYDFDVLDTNSNLSSTNTTTRITGQFYDDYIPSGESIEVDFIVQNVNGSSTLTQIVFTVLFGITLYIIVVDINDNNATGITPPNPGIIITVISPNIISIVYNDSITTYDITATYIQGADYLVVATKSVTKTTSFLIYGPSNVQHSSNMLSIPNYTGVLQIANIDPAIDYTPYLGSYATSINTLDYGLDGSFTLQLSTNNSTNNNNNNNNINNILMVLPNHWNEYNISGTVRLSNVLFTIMYGDVYYYSFVSSSAPIMSKVSPIIPIAINTNLITNPTAVITNNTQILNDIALNIDKMGDGPYQYGQNTYCLSRLFLYAKNNGILSQISSDISNVANQSIGWLTNKNNLNTSISVPSGYPNPNSVFHLQKEEYFKGVIVPADYLNLNAPQYYGNSNFGNSYYNDHHFHWGYMFYVWNSLYSLGVDIITSNIDSVVLLLRDVINPTTTLDATKTRHKNWFGAHSFATGFEPSNPNTNSGPVQRQQESCSEAINCYYACFLICNTIMNNTNLDAITRSIGSQLMNVSLVCLDTEIRALKNYYYMLAPNSSVGLMTQTGGVGILFNDAKECTLDWASQPNSHNGRMMGIYGIQALPFTDISFQQISSTWTTQISTSSNNNTISNVNNNNNTISNVSSNSNSSNSNGLDPSFVMDRTLILSCMNGNYTPILYVNELSVDPFNASTDSWYWSSVGAKILTYGDSSVTSLLNNNDCQNIIQILQNRQSMTPNIPIMKQFDSISHTYYIMASNGRMNNFQTNQLMFSTASINTDDTNIPQQQLPFPIPTCESLLASSELVEQCLFKVPLMFIGVTLENDNATINTSYYQIIDKYCYTSYSRKCLYGNISCYTTTCKVMGIKVSKVKVTDLQTKLDPIVMITAPGTTFQEKASNIGNGVSAATLILYSLLKLGLSKILYGKFDLKYLRQAYNDKFFNDLAHSRFCGAIAIFTDPQYNLISYNQYFLY